jgi:hypothetical protein
VRKFCSYFDEVAIGIDLPKDSLGIQEGNPINGVLRKGFTGTLFGCRGMASVDD